MTRRDRLSRRRLLGVLGAGTTAAFAGCSDIVGDDAPPYEEGTIGDADGEERSAEEMATAEALAEEEVNEGLTELDSLSFVDHEYVVEDDFRRATVQGTVENTGDNRIQRIEVRARVYDGDGELLGRYLDVTGDLDAGSVWAFEVILLESPNDIESYDVAVLGTPS